MEMKQTDRERWRLAGDAATAGDNRVALSAIFLQVSLFLFLFVLFFFFLLLQPQLHSRNALSPLSVVCDFLDIFLQPVIQLKRNML